MRSLSISKLLSRSTVKLPENDRGVAKVDVDGDQKLDAKDPNEPKSTDNFVRLPESETEGYVPDIDAEFEKNCKIVSDTLGKYEQWKNDPEGYVSLFGGLVEIPASGKLATAADKLKLINIVDNAVVRMPKYMEYEDQRAVTTALNAIKTTLSNVTGKLQTNYEALHYASNGLQNNIVTQVAGRLLESVGLDVFKTEFEKSRLSPEMPKSSEAWTIYETSGGNSFLGKLVSTLKDYAGVGTGDKGKRAGDVIYNQAKLSSDPRSADYLKFSDPYLGGNAKDISMGQNTIAAVQKFLSDAGYMAGYKDYAGFELGSNHLWKIELYPYEGPHGHTCTPPLPAYYLPALWSSENEFKSIRPNNGILKNILNFKWDYQTQKIVSRLTPVEMEEDGLATSVADKLINLFKKSSESGRSYGEFRQFSFSKNCPVISYDLNFGTMRTEAQQLFNGSAIELFSGMQYNATLNLSILDDIYQSMHKYWTHYINSIYDINTHSIAPYYNMAFEIVLTIFRSNYKINQKYRFIAVPIEYTPRLDGQSDPSEARIDMTFGIIGLIVPDGKKKNLYKDENISRGKSVDTRDGKPSAENNVYYTSEDPSDLTWGDIMINMGNKDE